MSDTAALLTQIANRLAAIEAHLGVSGNAGGSSASAGAASEDPRSIRAYDEYVSGSVTPFVEVCNKLGGDAALLGAAVKGAWDEQRSFLLMASQCKAPTKEGLMSLLAKVSGKMKEVAAICKRNEWEKHSKTCSEGVQCLNWLAVTPAPRDFIESFIGGSDYWSNNIRREFKTTNPDQVAFCDTFKKILVDLMAYVKEYHTTGVTWNPRGKDVSEYSASGASSPPPAPAAAASAAPVAAKPAAAPAAPAAAPVGNLFADLSKGGAITSGLKTVTKDMQTWRAEYKGGDSAPAAAAPVVRPKKVEETVKGTPEVTFVDVQSKWVIKYQSAVNGEVVVNATDKKQSVYIFGCIGATIKVTGKCNGIVVDNCKKCKISVDNVMAALETVNSQRINVVINERASSVAIDKTDGYVVFLSKTALETNIVASKSSEMNVQWMDDEDNLVERPIPEQYHHRVVPGSKSISAEVSDLYSH